MASRLDLTSNTDDVVAQLAAAGVELADLDAPNDEAGRVVLTAARPPRRTGRLANQLTANTRGGQVVFASAARYWTFVHWGAPARNMRANPWYREAVRATTDQLVGVYAAHARRALP